MMGLSSCSESVKSLDQRWETGTLMDPLRKDYCTHITEELELGFGPSHRLLSLSPAHVVSTCHLYKGMLVTCFGHS